jgi:hypothetical protein
MLRSHGILSSIRTHRILNEISHVAFRATYRLLNNTRNNISRHSNIVGQKLKFAMKHRRYSV